MSVLPKDVQSYFRKLQKDPARFAKEVLGITPWDKQVEILYSIRDNRKTTVRSCNAAGKTATAAMAVNWFLPSHPNSIVITTAPTWRQVEHVLWSEIRRQYYQVPKIPLGAKPLKTSWTLGPGWYALGLSTKEPDKFQGHHADYILGIVDEASGVDPIVFEALMSCLTSVHARVLYIGNPMEPAGTFYESFQDPTFYKVHISAYDTPNLKEGRVVYPSLISKEWIDDLKARLGKDYEIMPEYQIRVLGEFPTYSDDTVIPVAWVSQCIDLEFSESNDDSTCTIGVDVARMGDDETVVAVYRSKKIAQIRTIKHQDTVKVAEFVESDILKFGPSAVAIDGTGGLGAAVADILRSKGYKNVVDMAVNGKALRDDRFTNRRAELWWNLREQIRTKSLSIPNDEILKSQLSYPKYKFDSKGRYQIESKEDMRKRGLPSPDRAEAVMMAVSTVGPYPSFVASERKVVEIYPAGSLGWILSKFVYRKKEEFEWEN